MDKKREVINLPSFKENDEDGWETVRGIGKLDKEYIEPCIKKYCGKSFFGKTFRFAYIIKDNRKLWISKV